jgi:hypothetical protein
MRIWTIDPCHLDPQGLIALWREALLARAVLRGATKGYRVSASSPARLNNGSGPEECRTQS